MFRKIPIVKKLKFRLHIKNLFQLVLNQSSDDFSGSADDRNPASFFFRFLFNQKHSKISCQKRHFIFCDRDSFSFFNDFFSNFRHFISDTVLILKVIDHRIMNMQTIFQPIDHKENMIYEIVKQFIGNDRYIEFCMNSIQHLNDHVRNILRHADFAFNFLCVGRCPHTCYRNAQKDSLFLWYPISFHFFNHI